MKKHIIRDKKICDYPVYRIINHDGLNIIKEDYKPHDFTDDTCQVMLVEEYGKKYIFGTSPNGRWYGFKIDDTDNTDNLFRLFRSYDMM